MRVSDVPRALACLAVLAFLATPSAAEEQASVSDAQQYVFTGQTVCVCGHFPSPESRRGLLIGGLPFGDPMSASASMVELRVPEDVPPGRHLINGSSEAGFEEHGGVPITVLALSGSVDRDLLMKGEATAMRIRVEGSEDRLQIRLTNTTPEIIRIEGGDEGVVITSGGPENTVERVVRGVARGDFHIEYAMANDPCPCSPPATTATDAGASTPKVITADETVPTPTPVPESQNEVAEPPCDINQTQEHSELESRFVMSESYKDAETRAVLEQWFDDVPDPGATEKGGTFEAGTHPASVWAVAGREFIGGYANGVAGHLFLEADGGQDMVWSTELLSAGARSQGVHTVAVHPPTGETCDTLVVGAAGGVVEAWSNAIDPLARSRDVLAALRVARDVSIIVASAVLAPATAGGSIVVGVATLAATQAFDSAFSANANASAAAEGRMRLLVDEKELMLESYSRSSVTGDGDVESDGSRVSRGQASETEDWILTVSAEGLAGVKTKAEDVGIAEATLESQIGLAIVGLCYCDGVIQIEHLTDSGLFLAEEGAAGRANLANVRLKEMLQEVLEPYSKMAPEQVIPTARADLPGELEEMLEDWYRENGELFGLSDE